MKKLIIIFLSIVLLTSCHNKFGGTWMFSDGVRFELITFLDSDKILFTESIPGDTICIKSDTLNYSRKSHKFEFFERDSSKVILSHSSQNNSLIELEFGKKYIKLPDNNKLTSSLVSKISRSNWTVQYPFGTKYNCNLYPQEDGLLISTYSKDSTVVNPSNGNYKVLELDGKYFWIEFYISYHIGYIKSIESGKINIVFSDRDSLYEVSFIENLDEDNFQTIEPLLCKEWTLNSVNGVSIDSIELPPQINPCKDYVIKDSLVLEKDKSYEIKRYCYSRKGDWGLTSDNEVLFFDNGESAYDVWKIVELTEDKLVVRTYYRPIDGIKDFYNLEFTTANKRYVQ